MYEQEELEWTCTDCEDTLDRNSYVTMVNTVTGEVIKAEDGRVIDMEPKFPPKIEHLCYTCWHKKYKQPMEALRACLGTIAAIIELVEDLDDFDGLAVKEAVDKLNDLVVYIAGVLPKTTTLHLTAIIRKEEDPDQRPVGCYQGPMSGIPWKGCICPLIGTEKECLIDGQLCSSQKVET